MRKLLVASVVVLFGYAAVALSGAEDEKPKYSIKEVMKACMNKKGGICHKVAKGEASDEEKKKLAEMFVALHGNKPPMGEQASWDEKTKALVDAANEVLEGKEGAEGKLQAAANCMNCHKAHKGG